MYAPLQTPPFIQTVHGIWHPVTIGSIAGEPSGGGVATAPTGASIATAPSGTARATSAQSVGGSIRG